MTDLDIPDFAELMAAMQRAGLPFTAAEAHGVAAGMLAADVPGRVSFWAAEMYADLQADDVLANECRQLLDRLFRGTEQALADADFSFALYLPAETVYGLNRPAALRDWIQGFLFGFGLAGPMRDQMMSVEAAEALKDFAEIAKLEAGEDESEEDEQQALYEIEEYVRIAALLIFEDLHKGTEPDERE